VGFRTGGQGRKNSYCFRGGPKTWVNLWTQIRVEGAVMRESQN